MAFDQAWKKAERNHPKQKNNPEERLFLVLKELQDHPFLQEFPKKAKEVALFRIRLLDLK